MKNHVLAIGKYANGTKTVKVVQGSEIIETTSTYGSPSPVVVSEITLDVPDFMKSRSIAMQNERVKKDTRKVVNIFSNVHKKISAI